MTIIVSCTKTKTDNQKFDLLDELNQKIISLVVENANDKFIEFPDLYSELYPLIPDDENESLKIVDFLKFKGFETSNWGRGNYPPLGPRIISITLNKGNCECQVDKIYYNTNSENFLATERVKCKLKE